MARLRREFAHGFTAGESVALTLESLASDRKIRPADYPAIVALARELVQLYGRSFPDDPDGFGPKGQSEIKELLVTAFLVWNGEPSSYLALLEQETLDPGLARYVLSLLITPHHYQRVHTRGPNVDPKEAERLALVVAQQASDPALRRIGLYAIGGLRWPLEKLLKYHLNRIDLITLYDHQNIYYDHPERLTTDRVALLEDLRRREADPTNKTVLDISLAHIRKVQAGSTKQATEERMRRRARVTVSHYAVNYDLLYLDGPIDRLVPRLQEGEDVMLLESDTSATPVGMLRLVQVFPGSRSFIGRVNLIQPGDPKQLVGKTFILRRP